MGGSWRSWGFLVSDGVCDWSDCELTVEKVRSLLRGMRWSEEGVGGKLRRVNLTGEC